uniref:Uncharacterized protein n=1 Tax=Parascaris equorum TaxID=6256 RepID=A0A914RZ33_PAREQ
MHGSVKEARRSRIVVGPEVVGVRRYFVYVHISVTVTVIRTTQMTANGDIPESLEEINLKMNATTDEASALLHLRECY